MRANNILHVIGVLHLAQHKSYFPILRPELNHDQAPAIVH